jgi:D-alanyl-D-alanine carboxypeptidase/D-alanyl-D-alanine-endopeptidase (penicillin-binding protein 4)
LPEVELNVFAKSGTLMGVSTLAGYIHADKVWYPFAFMINQKVPYRYRNQLIKELSESY